MNDRPLEVRVTILQSHPGRETVSRGQKMAEALEKLPSILSREWIQCHGSATYVKTDTFPMLKDKRSKNCDSILKKMI